MHPTTPRALACVVFLFAILASASPLVHAATPSPAGAEAYFISPMNGAHVRGKFTVRFGLRGMGIAPAGVEFPGTGHHHLLINADPLPDLTLPLPVSESVRHFGKGQTETDIDLKPGTYTLQLVLGDYQHMPHQPPVMSGKITITVDP